MRLRTYQVESIEAIHDCFTSVDSVLLVLATGLGKAQPVDCGVLTPNGFVPMGTVRPGDDVIGRSGKPCKVLSVHPQGVKPVFRVGFSDGSSTRCCGEHLWSVNTKSRKSRGTEFVVKTTEELAGDLRDGSGANKWFLPLVEPIQFEFRDPPIDPYLLGILLGDGKLRHSIQISSGDDFIIKRAESLSRADLKRVGKYDYAVKTGEAGRRGSWLHRALKRLGLRGLLSHEKFIPDLYKYNETWIRLEILRGLMDTDGHVRKKDGHAEFNTVSRLLADDVCELVRSLGGCTRVRTKKPGTYTHLGEKRTGLPSFRVTVTLNGLNPFRLPRKARLVPLFKNQGQTKAVVSIERCGEAECKCLMVDNPEHLYVTDDYIVTHNTVVFSHFAGQWVHGRVMVIAHRDELIVQAAKKLHAITGEMPAIEQGQEHWSNESDMGRSQYIVGSKDSLHPKRLARFKDIGLLIIDEAHHAVKSNTTYWRIIKGLREKNPLLKILGVTATPKRHDKIAMGEIFEAVAYQYEIIDAVEDAWLVGAEAKLIEVQGLDLSRVGTACGDLKANELGKIMAEEESIQGIADSVFQECGNKRRVLCFTAGVEQAKKLAAQLNRREPDAAAWLCGKKTITSPQYRRECIRKFGEGDLKYLVNCGLFLEGFDEPRIDCLVMARPTKSEGLFKQMFGRGTRTFPGCIDGLEDAGLRREAIAASEKPVITVLDFVDNSRKHKLISTIDVLGGRASPEVQDEARNGVEQATKEGKATNIQDEIEAAKRRLQLAAIAAQRKAQEEAERLEEERRKALAARAEYSAQNTDVFDSHERGAGRKSAWRTQPATPKQKAYLKYQCGINGENMMKHQASAIIAKHKNGTLKPRRQNAEPTLDEINRKLAEASSQ